MGSDGSPTLDDTAYLTAPDGVFLLERVIMARSAHARLWVVLAAFLGMGHPAIQVMDAVVRSLMDRETELED